MQLLPGQCAKWRNDKCRCTVIPPSAIRNAHKGLDTGEFRRATYKRLHSYNQVFQEGFCKSHPQRHNLRTAKWRGEHHDWLGWLKKRVAQAPHVLDLDQSNYVTLATERTELENRII